MKLLKFHTSPKNFSPVTERRRSRSPFLSTTGSFTSGNQSNNNTPSWPRPSRWESQSSKSISLRLKSLGYMHSRSVCSGRLRQSTASQADYTPVLNPCLKMQWISDNWGGEQNVETVRGWIIEEVSLFTHCTVVNSCSSYFTDAWV